MEKNIFFSRFLMNKSEHWKGFILSIHAEKMIIKTFWRNFTLSFNTMNGLNLFLFIYDLIARNNFSSLFFLNFLKSILFWFNIKKTYVEKHNLVRILNIDDFRFDFLVKKIEHFASKGQIWLLYVANLIIITRLKSQIDR